MATLYLKAAGGNWTAAGTWSNVNAAGGDSSGPPTAADNCIAELASGNVTIDSGAVCRSFDTTSGTGSYGGTITHTAAVTLTIGDATAGVGNVAIKLNSGITYTLGSASTSAISFVSTSGTQQTITSAGKSFGNFTINGTGSSYLLSDAMTIASTALVTLTAGTFDTGGVACAWGSFTTTGSVARTLTLGASTITMNGNVTNNWNVSGSNITLNANTSSIITTTNAGAGSTLFSGGSLTYNIVSFTGSGEVRITGTSTFGTLTRTGTAAKTDSFYLASNITVTGTLNLNGNSATNRLLVFSSTLGTAITLTAANVSVTNADFRDITGAGAGSWDLSAITGLSGDCGGNSGITFTDRKSVV